MRVPTPRRVYATAALCSVLMFTLSCGGDGGSPSPTPTDLVVTPGSDTLLALGETQAFVASVLDANGDPIDRAVVTWSSTAPTVVSVDPATGVATAVANGSAQIQASSGALIGASPVTVAQVPTTVTITPATVNFTFVGDTQTFTATVLDAGGAPVVPVQKIWTLNDNTVAVIDSTGRARAKGPGIAMVTVVAIGPGGAKAGYAAVNSTQPVAALVIRSAPTFTIAGESLDPAVQVEVRDSGGAVVTGYSGPITIGVDSGPVGAPLRGTKTVPAINGVSSFSGLSLEKAGVYHLGATATSLAPASTPALTVTHTASYALRLATEPIGSGGSVVAGAPIPISAYIVDRFQNRTYDTATVVTLEFVAGPPGGDVFGDPVGDPDPSGTYDFPGAHLERAMVGYVLRVAAPGLLPDSTTMFGVIHGPPYRLRLSGDSAIKVGAAIGTQLRVQVFDAFENQAFAAPVPVTLSAWWAFSAPAGKGQQVLPADTLLVNADTTLFDHYLTRPGLTALIVSSPGLISDTGGTFNARFIPLSAPYLGAAQICFNDHYCGGANGHGELGVDPAILAEDSVVVLPDSGMNDAGPYAFGLTSLCSVELNFATGAYTVKCRGANDEGQLGRGTTGADDHQFQRIPGAIGWWTVAMGDAHGCALVADSTAACWGRNDHGQLGRGTTTANEPTPAAVLGGIKFQALVAGGDHTCGITLASGIFCWGANSFGELGDSTTTDRSQPVALVGSNVWAELSAGAGFTCGVKTNLGRKVLCWGTNVAGQLGDAAAGVGRIYPALVTGGLNDLPFGLVSGTAHSCTIANTTMICWGDDSRGQIGNGGASGPVYSPYGLSFPNGRSPFAVAAGGRQTCAATDSFFEQRQTLMCWGANDRGQLGDGTTADRNSPIEPVQ